MKASEIVSIAPKMTEPIDVPGEYRPLHKYLDGRYADTVVLRFAEIEDLLGFALPDPCACGKTGGRTPTLTAAVAQSRSWIALQDRQVNLIARPSYSARRAP
jgi:hypothetical protein